MEKKSWKQGENRAIFASYEEGDFRGKSIDKPIGVTVYTSPIPWIINKTSECYPKDMTRLWEQVEMEVPAEDWSASRGCGSVLVPVYGPQKRDKI